MYQRSGVIVLGIVIGLVGLLSLAPGTVLADDDPEKVLQNATEEELQQVEEELEMTKFAL